MNLFARSIGIPLDLEAALTALATGEVQEVDIATANGRPFVHQFSVGIHPKLVKLREQLDYKSRIGKMLASTRAAIGAVLRPPNFTIELVGPFGSELRRIAGLSVSNNPLDEGHLPLADRLDRGLLGIYLVKPLTPRVMVRLAFGLLRGKFKSLPEVIDREASQATIRFPAKRSSAMAVIDGELIKLEQRDRVDHSSARAEGRGAQGHGRGKGNPAVACVRHKKAPPGSPDGAPNCAAHGRRSEAVGAGFDRLLAKLAQGLFDRLQIFAVVAVHRGHALGGAALLAERVGFELTQDLRPSHCPQVRRP